MADGEIEAARKLATVRVGQRQNTTPFIKGPIPLDWVSKAACLGGKSLHLALAVWWRCKLTRRASVKLTPSICQAFGVHSRRGRNLAIQKLAGANLVSVERSKTASPVVTLLADGHIATPAAASIHRSGAEQQASPRVTIPTIPQTKVNEQP